MTKHLLAGVAAVALISGVAFAQVYPPAPPPPPGTVLVPAPPPPPIRRRLAARSVTLLAFGVDSLIELASSAVLIWRLTVELRYGQSFAVSVEQRARRIGGALLFALAAYVVVAAAWSLWTGEGQEFSWPALLVSLIALLLMWTFSRRKLRLADALGNRALHTDAVESIACGSLSLVVVIGLLAQLVLGAWWVDPVTSLAILWLLIKEGREAWKGRTTTSSGYVGFPACPPYPGNGRRPLPRAAVRLKQIQSRQNNPEDSPQRKKCAYWNRHPHLYAGSQYHSLVLSRMPYLQNAPNN